MKGMLASAWLGFSLDYFCKLSFENWEFWTIMIPTVVLFTLSKYED